ncbi:MAG: heme-binding protein [Candidatus Carbobacillus altaicus]|nr:heme-binding protein [Candidatus Carbobacillus altaicus]
MDHYVPVKHISLKLAQTLLERAVLEAETIGAAVNVAIVDASAQLKAFYRMDGAPLLSSGIAQRKAYTAAAFGLETSAWYDMIKDHPRLLHGLPHTPDLVIFGGGFPIRYKGEMIGAIGVSGGTEEQDEQICKAALQVLEEMDA